MSKKYTISTEKSPTLSTTALNEDEEANERGNWSGKLDFLLSAIGYAVGLGNVWRFPYLAYKNGGATFLIPYVIMLVTAGLPLFFLELSFGQFSSLGPISVWRAVPILRGLGFAMVAITAMVCIYYNMIIAYTLYYFFASFTSYLPWSSCSEEWVEKYGCKEREFNSTVRNYTEHFCRRMREENNTDSPHYIGNCTMTKGSTPPGIFWSRIVLDISNGINEGADEIRWQLALCFLLAWVIIFLCLCKGIKSSGKVVYFTATFPYVVLIALFFRNITLKGAWRGIYFYLVPVWSKLADYTVWYSAAVQIFYSLGVGFGSLTTMASYNRFTNNVYRDALIVAVLNCSTSVFAGFVIFSVLGYMSEITGVPVQAVADSGPGLAFIAYPEGIALMPAAPFWSILFFFMLFLLGLDSQFAMMETIISAVSDEIPALRKGLNKVMFTAILCLLMFLLGLPQCSRAGVYVMTLFDWYCAGFSLMIVALIEVIGINWIYGYRQFADDISMMIGHKPNIYWMVTWCAITPAMLLFIIIFAAVQFTPATYNSYVYPGWANNIGWLMVVSSLTFIPALALYEYCRAHDFKETFTIVLRPTDEWGPALEEHRSGTSYGSMEVKPRSTSTPSEDLKEKYTPIDDGVVNAAYQQEEKREQ